MTSEPSTTTTSSDSTPTVVGVIAAARAELSEGAFISRSDATDWLLDGLNASVRPAVRAVILAALRDFSHRNMAPVAEFVAALDQVQMALQVDAAFDDYELEVA